MKNWRVMYYGARQVSKGCSYRPLEFKHFWLLRNAARFHGCKVNELTPQEFDSGEYLPRLEKM